MTGADTYSLGYELSTLCRTRLDFPTCVSHTTCATLHGSQGRSEDWEQQLIIVIDSRYDVDVYCFEDCSDGSQAKAASVGKEAGVCQNERAKEREKGSPVPDCRGGKRRSRWSNRKAGDAGKPLVSASLLRGCCTRCWTTHLHSLASV